MIQWWNTGFGENEAKAAYNLVLSGQLNEGSVTRKFESILADYLKVPFVKAVPSGTVALTMALWALGIKSGDEILVPDITFIATANAVHCVGAKPVFVDVDRHDFNISVEALEKKMSKKVKAVIVVHINGRACDIEGLKRFKQKYENIPIIEDTAQGLGSRYFETYLGTIFDIGTISLAPSKVISTGQGGLLLTRNEKYHEQFIRLKDHGRLSRQELSHKAPGFNFKFTDLQAAIGIEQLKLLPERLAKAKQDYFFYKERLQDIPEIHMPPVNFGRNEFPLWIDAITEQRAPLFAYLESKKIYPRPIWGSLHREWYAQEGEFEASNYLNDTAFWLPSGPILPTRDMETVCQEVRHFFGKK